MTNRVKTVSLILCTITLICTALIAAHSLIQTYTAYSLSPGTAAKQNTTVRVAFPHQAGMTFKTQSGKRSGYTYEYLQEVAQYTEWNYNFVDLSSDDSDSDGTLIKTLEMIRDGELDIAGGWSFSDELAQTYNFTYSSHSYGSVETVLQALYESDRDYVINSQIDQSFRIAIPKNASRTLKEVEEFCEINRITPTFVFCESYEDQIAALKKDSSEEGYAELMTNTSFSYIEGVHTVAKFAPKPFYFIVSKSSPSFVMHELDSTMIKIDSASPLFTSSLYEKYFSPDSVKLNLNETEKAFIANAGSVRVGVQRTGAPYQYLKDNDISGITADLLSYISQRTGLNFQYRVYDDYASLLAAGKSGEIRLIGGLTYDYDLAADFNVSLSRSFLDSQYVMLSKNVVSEGDLSNRRLAVCTEFMPENVIEENTLICPDIQSCIDAVYTGKADYTYADAYTAQYFIALPNYSKLKFSMSAGDTRRISFGVVKGGNKTLLGILNKVLTVMTESEMQSIVNRNLVAERSYSLYALLQAYPVQFIAVIAAVFAAVLSLLTVILVLRVRSTAKNREELAKHYRLFGLVSECLVEYDYRTKKLLVNMPGKDGENRIEQYDFGSECRDAVTRRRRQEFMNLINRANGVKEVCLDTKGGIHWIKIALETESKNNVPLYTLGKLTFIDEIKQQESNLLEQATRDSLTHLYNAETTHRLMREKLAEMKKGESFSIIIADIDLFKQINDNFGHLQGDSSLIAFAELLKSLFNDFIIGRPGGDEFVIGLHKVGRKKLTSLCMQLCESAKQLAIRDGQMLSVSVGAASSVDGESCEELFERADKALYKAKHNQRGGYSIASPPKKNVVLGNVSGVNNDSANAEQSSNDGVKEKD